LWWLEVEGRKEGRRRRERKSLNFIFVFQTTLVASAAGLVPQGGRQPDLKVNQDEFILTAREREYRICAIQRSNRRVNWSYSWWRVSGAVVKGSCEAVCLKRSIQSWANAERRGGGAQGP
jgi:hypothetical protein